MRLSILIFSPRLVLGTPKNAGVTWHFRPLLGPREAKGEVATSDFIPAVGVGDPQECRGYIAIPPSFGPREGRGEAANSDFVLSFDWGPPRMHGVT